MFVTSSSVFLRISLGLTIAVAGCGDDEESADGPTLTCSSLAFCTNHEVTMFVGEMPEPAGGKIANGIYRLAWGMRSDGTAINDISMDGFIVRGSQYLNSSAIASVGNRGTFTTNGTSVTFTSLEPCFGSSTDPDASPDGPIIQPYTATSSLIYLFGEAWVYVYERVLDPNDLCETVSEPSAPSYSATCSGSCYCSVTSGGTLDPGLECGD